jgi:hypothetical protein
MYEKDLKDLRDYDRWRQIRWDFLEDEISRNSIRWAVSERNRENISQQIQTHQSVSSSTHARTLIRVISESRSHRNRKQDSKTEKNVRNLQRLREINSRSLIRILYQLHLYHDLLLRKNQSRSARDYVVVSWKSTSTDSSLRVIEDRFISRYRDTLTSSSISRQIRSTELFRRIFKLDFAILWSSSFRDVEDDHDSQSRHVARHRLANSRYARSLIARNAHDTSASELTNAKHIMRENMSKRIVRNESLM